MTRTAIRNHVLVAVGTLMVLGLFGAHLGVNYDMWWLLIAVATVLHLGLFTTLIGWVVRRVRKHREEGHEAAG
jgi:ABC-type transport system involved in Fe-S cluster assembly fused permease/ATPase subunit